MKENKNIKVEINTTVPSYFVFEINNYIESVNFTKTPISLSYN